MPEISVIVPVFNAEKFLAECIESILAQSYPDFELLLINDGSIDKSGEICDEYCKKDNRIHAIHQPNAGVTAARKTGWQKSKGNWIVFVDADDLAHLNLLDVLISNAHENDCDIVNASFQSVPSGRKWIHKKLGQMSHREYLESFLYNQTYSVVYASIYRKSIILASTFDFDATLKIGEDILMNIELALRSRKAVNLGEIVYDYKDNETSVMNRKVQHPLYFERYYEVKEKLFRKANLSNEWLTVLQLEKYNAQRNAFYSPFIKFDTKSLNKLKLLKSQLPELIDRSFINRVQTLALQTKSTARLLKFIYNWKYILKQIIKGNLFPGKEVIY